MRADSVVQESDQIRAQQSTDLLLPLSGFDFFQREIYNGGGRIGPPPAPTYI